MVNEIESYIDEVVDDGDHQRSTPIVVLSVDICSILMQNLHYHRVLSDESLRLDTFNIKTKLHRAHRRDEEESFHPIHKIRINHVS